MTPVDFQLARFPSQFNRVRLDDATMSEAARRVLDSFGCFYGAYNAKPGRVLRSTLAEPTSGECTLWGTRRQAAADAAAWTNGTCVRTLDYNDTYLSLEPCHPSDLLASLWAACELSGKKEQGRLLLRAMVLGYEVMCRLCDAASLRVRGWDHVTYLPIASAVACSYIFGLDPTATRNAIALAVTPNNALRQTRVGEISDWKAACAAYGARAGLWAARLASHGFSGPYDPFAGRHGFFAQVSGRFKIAGRPLRRPWMILSTHVKFHPAEHHAQSAIEAALEIRRRRGGRVGPVADVKVEAFDVASAIIGSEKEKWQPKTRETADHSLPYLVAVALLDGDVNLRQYERRRYLDADVRALMKKTRVSSSARYTRLYPKKMPSRVTLRLSGGATETSEVMLPKGYAGRPLTDAEFTEKFMRLAAPILEHRRAELLAERLLSIDRVGRLADISPMLEVR